MAAPRNRCDDEAVLGDRVPLARLGIAIALAAGVGLASACSAKSTDSATPTSPGSTSIAPSPTAPGAQTSWTAYHANDARTGAVRAGATPLTPSRLAWSVDLGGAVRGQPLVVDGRIIAATETNRVVALDPASGKVLWSRTIGAPLRNVAQVAGCGNIDPLGITSTPVADVSMRTIYVVGEIDDGGGAVHHQLVGLDLSTGRTRVSSSADPPLPSGQRAVHLLQRAGLALRAGVVYVPYGGNLGDCGTYHGWVVGVDTTGKKPKSAFEVAPGSEGGAIWSSGGAPAIDTDGNIYVSTGNANPFPSVTPDPARYAESVLKLSPELRLRADFKDPRASGDEDLATGNPVLLPGGEVFSVGKTDVGYFLDRRDLHLVATVSGVCGSDPDGGPAYDAGTGRLFVPCRAGGIQVIDVATHRLGPRLKGADSAPIVIGKQLWALDSESDRLTTYDIARLKQVQSLQVGADVPVFASPSTGAGLVLVGTTRGVTAFRPR